MMVDVPKYALYHSNQLTTIIYTFLDSTSIESEDNDTNDRDLFDGGNNNGSGFGAFLGGTFLDIDTDDDDRADGGCSTMRSVSFKSFVDTDVDADNDDNLFGGENNDTDCDGA